MKRRRALQRKRATQPIKPRNPIACDPLLGKGGAHARHDKKASRARQKARWRREPAT